MGEPAEVIEEEIEENAKETEEPEADMESEKVSDEEPDQIDVAKIVEERFYTIPLGRAWISQRKKRAPKAMRQIKRFVKKHMKIRDEDTDAEAEKLVISNEVNEKIWSRGIEKPPRKIMVRAVKDEEGVVTLYLAKGA
jgi:large subunit ribosomal protein L31e